MKHDEYLGFAAIRDDDEFLDRLARRESVGDDGFGELFSSWTREIDLDAVQSAERTGPWKLRGEVPARLAPQPPVRTVRIQGKRAAAVVGAIAITLSGGSVAAALSGAGHPISDFLPPLRGGSTTVASTEQASLGRLTQAVIQEKIAQGRYTEARALIQDLQVKAAGNPVALADVSSLSQLVDQAQVSSTTTKSPTDIPTTPGTDPTQAPAPAPAPTQSGEPAPTPGMTDSPDQTAVPSPTGPEPSAPSTTPGPSTPSNAPSTPNSPEPSTSSGTATTPPESSSASPTAPDPTREATGTGTRSPRSGVANLLPPKPSDDAEPSGTQPEQSSTQGSSTRDPETTATEGVLVTPSQAHVSRDVTSTSALTSPTQ